MSDLIRREDAIDELMALRDAHKADQFTGDLLHWTGIKAMLESIPSAEPERKTGKWNFIGDNMFKCTCCGVLYTTHQLDGLRNCDTDPYVPYFCPHCGAEMTR